MALMQQGRDDAGVDAAGEPADHAIGAHQLTDVLDALVDDVDHRPQRRNLSDIVQERPDDVLAVLGVNDLGMELRCVELAFGVFHRRDGSGRSAAVTTKPSGTVPTLSR